MAEQKKEESFEDALERLQTVVRQLESGECTLEDSLKKFSEGMELAKGCQQRLNLAEQQIEILVKASKDGIQTEPFADKS